MSISISTLLDKKSFYKDGAIAFDLSSNSDILFVQFFPQSPTTPGELEHYVKTIVSTHKISVIAITGTDVHRVSKYRLNLDGIPGFDSWSDPYYLGKFLHELCLVRNNFKYIIFFGDCGGAYTALVSSRIIPIQSLVLTTPALLFVDLEKMGYSKNDITSYQLKKTIIDNIHNLPTTDGFIFLSEHIEAGVKVDIHWASNVRKTDLWEKQRVSAIENKRNLTIHSHIVPNYVVPHNLYYWLAQTARLSQIITKEVIIARAYLDTING